MSRRPSLFLGASAAASWLFTSHCSQRPESQWRVLQSTRPSSTRLLFWTYCKLVLQNPRFLSESPGGCRVLSTWYVAPEFSKGQFLKLYLQSLFPIPKIYHAKVRGQAPATATQDETKHPMVCSPVTVPHFTDGESLRGPLVSLSPAAFIPERGANDAHLRVEGGPEALALPRHLTGRGEASWEEGLCQPVLRSASARAKGTQLPCTCTWVSC